jgi:hypothetical protein
MKGSHARQWERNDVIAYLYRRAAEFRHARKFAEAAAIDDMAREIENARHHLQRRASRRGAPNITTG